ncbi:MAG: hypothetical protein R3F42_00965 [Pseudomonadota bacterium]
MGARPAQATQRIRDVAAELLDIYARRAARGGHAYQAPRDDTRPLPQPFRSRRPRTRRRPSARCWPTCSHRIPWTAWCAAMSGFGKTEVAMRAAFVAVQDGRQVAVLVTDHAAGPAALQNFRDRFADWPVRIEMLSRFRTGRQPRTARSRGSPRAVSTS